MSDEVRTWHHGLVARWWAEFNQGGDDVEYFQRAIGRSGEPVLDAGCGAGRLLLPLRSAGIDADGSDASPDMLAWCHKGAAARALTVNLYPQAMHELDLPRRYRTIVVCGAFGLGGTRAHDLEGLRRIQQHLEPGGALVMDYHLPNLESAKSWSSWVEKPELPRPWPKRADRRRASDGTELELRTRQLAFDPLEQTTTLQMRAAQFVDGNEVLVETNAIDICIYFKSEIELMLGAAGLREVQVTRFPDDLPPQPWKDQRIVFRATA